MYVNSLTQTLRAKKKYPHAWTLFFFFSDSDLVELTPPSTLPFFIFPLFLSFSFRYSHHEPPNVDDKQQSSRLDLCPKMAPLSYSKTAKVPRRPFEAARLFVSSPAIILTGH